MMAVQHRELSAGGWSRLSLVEQLANVGAEVGRMLRWRARTSDSPPAPSIAPSSYSIVRNRMLYSIYFHSFFDYAREGWTVAGADDARGRKVRAPQGRVLANSQGGQPHGPVPQKANRRSLARAVRVKR
jgi:hypothetical protein